MSDYPVLTDHPPALIVLPDGRTFAVGGQWVPVPAGTTREDLPMYAKWRGFDEPQKDTWKVGSSSDPEITYTVTHNLRRDEWSCDCPANLRARNRGNCKHIRSLREVT